MTTRLAAELDAALIEQRLDAMRADLASGVVPDGVVRPLFDHELEARTNFAGIEDDVARQAAILGGRTKADRARFIALLDADLRATARQASPFSPLQRIALRIFDLDGPAGITALRGGDELLAEAERYHRGRLTVAATGAARRVLGEAKAQGLLGPDDIDVKLSGVHADQLDLLAKRIAQAPHVDVLRALRDQVIVEPKDFVGPDELVDQLVAHARGLSEAPLEDMAGTAVQQADAMGRVAGAESLPVPKSIYASELLDRRTCGACSLVDGKPYATMAEAMADYPHGTYRLCEGGLRCRGTLVFVWSTEADPTLQTPGDTPKQRATKPAPSGTVPPSARLGIPAPTSGNPARDSVLREAHRVVRIMGELHALPAAAFGIPVRLGTVTEMGGPGTLGYHSAWVGGRSNEIRLLIGQADAGFTFAHEAGHYIDWEAIGGFGSHASAGGKLAGVMTAIDQSTAVAQLRRIAANPASPANVVDHVNGYLLDPAELWARAYSQWVALRSEDAVLRKAVTTIAGNGPQQWTDADFTAIAAEIDRVMSSLGFTP